MSSNACSDVFLDAFLSYNSHDRSAVEELAGRLGAEGVVFYLDAWDVLPGREFQHGLADALIDSKTCIAVLGPNGLGPWQKEEIQVAIDKRVRDPDFHVIPVLLPGAERPRRGAVAHLEFLINASWVEFPKSLDDRRAFDRLVAGIRGIKPTLSPEEVKRWEGRRPYRGLEAFGLDDAPFFFGRENLTDWLVSDLRHEIRAPAGVRFLAVLGPSGSGKSSVVLAGLIPRLKEGAIDGSDRWPIAVVRPGDDPLKELGTAVAAQFVPAGSLPDAKQALQFSDDMRSDERMLDAFARMALNAAPAESRLLVVVDQFEELFTYRPEGEKKKEAFAKDRDGFLANLLHAAAAPGGRVAVVLTMRSDFLGPCASFERLNDVLNAHLIQVGPMREDELRAAIELPAFKVGCELEPGLTERLLADVEGQAGALPLLQFTLDELWQRREVRRLTLRAYTELGGVEGALEHRAEETLQKLSQADQDLCRRIFLRLVQPGEGTEDTKRRVSYLELLPDDPERAEAVRRVVRALTDRDARLITTQGDPKRTGEVSVEVAHEALIRGWDRLRKWIDADRAGLRIQRELTAAAREWEANRREGSFLYGGTRLAVAREWAKTHRGELNALEEEFLAASRRKLRRGILVQTAPALAVLGLVIGGWAWFLSRERSRLRETTQAVEKSLRKAGELGDEGHWSDAILKVVAALRRLESGVGNESLRHQVAYNLELYKKKEAQKAQEHDSRIIAALDEARIAGAASAKEGGARSYVAAPSGGHQHEKKAIISGYQRAFREYGIDIDTLSSQKAAELIRAKPPEILQALAAALDDWAWRAGPPEDSRLRTIAREADPDPQRNAIRDAVAKGDVPALRQLARDLDVAHQPFATLNQLACALIQAREFCDALALSHRAQLLNPGDFWINFDLAYAFAQVEPAIYDEAIRYYAAAIVLQPDNPTVRNSLGLTMRNKGRIDEAIVDYDQAIRLDPKYAWPYNNRGLIWYAKQEYGKAIADYDQAIRLDPKYATAYNGRGNVWYAKREYDKAIADYDQAIRLDPKDAWPYNNRGLIWYAKQEYDKAIADYDQAIRLDPKDAWPYNNRGLIWYAKQEHDKAIADYDQAIDLDPKYATAYDNRGDAWYAKREYDKAIADYDQAIRLDPKDATAYNGRGNVWYAKREYDKAIADYDQAIRLDPKYVTAYDNRGDAWYAKREYDKAIADYGEAIRLDPKYATAYNDRGYAWRAKKEYGKAIADYGEAIRLDPKDPRAYKGRAWLWATCPDEKYRDGKKAIESATRAGELTEWKDADHLDTLAAAWAEARDFDAAVKWQEKALGLLAKDDEPKRKDFNARLTLYQAKKPYHEEPKAERAGDRWARAERP